MGVNLLTPEISSAGENGCFGDKAFHPEEALPLASLPFPRHHSPQISRGFTNPELATLSTGDKHVF